MDIVDGHVGSRQVDGYSRPTRGSRKVDGYSRPTRGSWPPQWYLLPKLSEWPWNVTWSLPRNVEIAYKFTAVSRTATDYSGGTFLRNICKWHWFTCANIV